MNLLVADDVPLCSIMFHLEEVFCLQPQHVDLPQTSNNHKLVATKSDILMALRFG